MTSTYTFKLSLTTLKKLRGRGHALFCRMCFFKFRDRGLSEKVAKEKAVLKVGEVVVSRRQPRVHVRDGSVHYHKECWDKTYVA